MADQGPHIAGYRLTREEGQPLLDALRSLNEELFTLRLGGDPFDERVITRDAGAWPSGRLAIAAELVGRLLERPTPKRIVRARHLIDLMATEWAAHRAGLARRQAEIDEETGIDNLALARCKGRGWFRRWS